MTKPPLTETDFVRAAKRLRCEVPAIKAVAEVESRNQGFYADGFPVILFERHIFRKYTQGRYNNSHPDLSGPAGNYGKAGQNQRNKFSRAFALNPDAAMKACSWGKFQIMGFNHGICGFSTVGEFVDAMKESEGNHLDAFVSFVIGNGLGDELRSLEWAKFASGYNGSGYKKNRYDTKMAAAYRKYSAQSAEPISTAAKPQPVTNYEQPPAQQPASDPPPPSNIVKQDGPPLYQGVGFWSVIKRDLSLATGGNLSFSGLSEYAQQASGWPEWVVALLGKVAVGALIATIGYFIFRVVHYFVDTWKQNQRTKLLADINTDMSRKDLELQ